nr:hypothetical protein BaRGS_017689 [Batillaria attramentaria]
MIVPSEGEEYNTLSQNNAPITPLDFSPSNTYDHLAQQRSGDQRGRDHAPQGNHGNDEDQYNALDRRHPPAPNPDLGAVSHADVEYSHLGDQDPLQTNQIPGAKNTPASPDDDQYNVLGRQNLTRPNQNAEDHEDVEYSHVSKQANPPSTGATHNAKSSQRQRAPEDYVNVALMEDEAGLQSKDTDDEYNALDFNKEVSQLAPAEAENLYDNTCVLSGQEVLVSPVVRACVRALVYWDRTTVTATPSCMAGYVTATTNNLQKTKLSTSLSGISETLLIQLAAGFTATTQELIHAWHNKYHDDIGFITATVNNVVDSNKNGILDITDITAVKDIARNEYGKRQWKVVLDFGLDDKIGVLGQNHGHGHGHDHSQLHGGICHSNHMQLTEDQVIHQLVTDIDGDQNNNITSIEMFLFFGGLLGKAPQVDPSTVTDLSELSDAMLAQLSESFSDPNRDLIQAWHNRYHDSMDFIEATVNNVLDANSNGIFDVYDIMTVKTTISNLFDANHDGTIEQSELVAFFENIYKSGNCH